MREESNRKFWSFIINEGDEEDKLEGAKGTGRRSTTNFAVTHAMEKEEDAWQAVARAMIDVRLGQLLACLKVWSNRGRKQEKMYMPKTGGRFLLTSRGCKRQVLHSDFNIEPKKNTSILDKDFNPGYFALCSGELRFRFGLTIWVICIFL